jgi:hypothetical protein
LFEPGAMSSRFFFCHGQRPSISKINDQLRKVLITTIAANTATLLSDEVTRFYTVRQ